MRRALAALIPVVALVTGAVVPSAGAVDDPDPAPPVTDPAPVSDPAPAPAASLSTTAIPSWGTAKVDGKSKAQRVNAIVEAGGIAYLGGQFTKMVPPGGGSTTSRGYLAAIDGTTGDLTGWNPKASGKVFALELSADGKSVYAGGDFSYIGGRSAPKLAKIDLVTGKLDPMFKPVVKGRVRGLALDGDRLYVAGDFLSVGGQDRPKLAAVDPVTGAVLPWTPPPLGPGRYIGHTGIPTPDYSAGNVYAVEAFGGKVFAAGNFLDFGGQGGLVTLDAATGALAEPQYEPGRPIFDLASAGGFLYAVGGGPGGRAYAFSPDDDKPLWKVKFDGDAVGVAVSNSTVYVAGHYDYIVSKDSSCYQYCPGGPRRHHLSAFNATDGLLQAWNPDADTSTGPFTLAVGANALYVGGEFMKINFKAQPGFTIFPGTA
ncbi:MAG TPA: PQQ-binding-like beta-propeller repeat protein [Acidimicrobiia bacterium]|nr:PQQ-binding-like beta-propeller repeat protein [Acidimicrobiia bacterium]